MKTWLKVLILTLVIAAPAFLASPNGPLVGLWDVSAQGPQPTAVQLPFFIILNALDALMLGLGVSFLVFGYSLLQRVSPGVSKSLTAATYLSIAFLLLQWWPHDNLHMSAGENLQAILAIDYIFHVPIMIASLVVVFFFVNVLRGQSSAMQRSQKAARA